jgi:hypothetical protein
MLKENTGRKGTKYYTDSSCAIITKECNRCNQVKELSEFTVAKKGLGGRDSRCRSCRAEYHINNREYINARVKKWADVNKDRVKEYKHEYQQINKERLNKRSQEYYQNNKERKSDMTKIYYTKNRDQFLLRVKRRRAREKFLPDTLTKAQMEQILGYFGGCVFTKEIDDIHWDHVIPLSVGHEGTSYGNMIPLRSDLNISKNNSNIFEWFEANRQRLNLRRDNLDSLVVWLADANGVSVNEYKDYVYWCHENPHSLEDLEEREVE